MAILGLIHQSLVDATNFVKTVEDHQGIKIAALEEIGYINGWINKETLIESGDQCSKMAMVNIY